MGEFFRGWRRRAGCIGLVMACAACGAWIRSYYALDTVTFPFQGRQHTIFSVDGLIIWPSVHTELQPKWGWQSLPASRLMSATTVRSMLDLNQRGQNAGGDRRFRKWEAHYWMFAIP